MSEMANLTTICYPLACASDVTSMLENTKKREEDVTETFDGKNVNTLRKAGEVATAWDIRI